MITIQALPNLPQIHIGDNVAQEIVKSINEHNIPLKDNSILCVASKVISISENRIVDLDQVEVSQTAFEMHEQLKRKDPSVIQMILESTPSQDGKDVEIIGNYIGAWLPNGLKLTSAGIDQYEDHKVICLPDNPDLSAQHISHYIYEKLDKKVAVIITDSDGRIDKLGATQIAIGVYGIHPLRVVHVSEKTTSETICDMLAASAGLMMGQRGTNKPVVLIHGFDFDFNENTSIKDAIVKR